MTDRTANAVRGACALLTMTVVAGMTLVIPAFAAERPTAQVHADLLIPGGDVPLTTVPPVDLQAVAAEDQQRAADGMAPRFAIASAVSISPESHGVWERTSDDTMVWRLRIASSDASSINLGFGGYDMPDGGRLFVYALDFSEIVRPFTAQDNATHGELWTPVVRSEEIVVEVTLPTRVRDELRLSLTSINVGYRGFGSDPLNRSGSCNVDVVCPQGNGWEDEIASNAVYSTGGALFCSGSMVNNTAQDQRPLFLTANHCGINAGNAASLVVYWNYETSSCGGTPDGSLNDFQSGAFFRAGYAASDFTLVELDEDPHPSWGVTYGGWDRSGASPSAATAIHHPNTDEKRISFENDPTSVTTYLGTAVPGDGTHIRIADWDDGTTEGGSSGSPLYDPNHRVVGQLHGGFAACGNNSSDWYGRLSVSWNGGGTSSSRLSTWLDPGGTGATTVDTLVPAATGGCCNGASCTAETQSDCTGAGGTYLGDGVACVTAAGSPTTYSANPGASIPDGGGAGNPLTHTINVGDSYTVGDVNVGFDISHTYVGDLSVELEHAGVTVSVMHRPGFPASNFGCSLDNMNVVADDEGAGGELETQCANNLSSPPNYLSALPLDAFDGLNVNGAWTIRISDFATPDPGTLNSWSLEIDGAAASPCGCSVNADCSDGLFCNGTETCSGGTCQAGSDPCMPGEVCDEVGDTCTTPVCNMDLTCDAGEDCNNCASDCPSGSGASCGNGVCEPGEDCSSCSQDCRAKLNGNPNRQYCCSGDPGGSSGPNPTDCNDPVCSADVWECSFTADSFCCGDGTCDAGEDAVNCAIDCVVTCSVPADCNDGKTCTDDTCVASDCVNTPNDANCPDDGMFCNGTEFCDGTADCSSTGDPCSASETCNEVTEMCDSCLPKNASCSLNGECCSGVCKNNGRCR